MPEIRIIPFTPEYAGELGQLHWQVWEETYRGLIPDAYLDTFTPEKWTEKPGGIHCPAFSSLRMGNWRGLPAVLTRPGNRCRCRRLRRSWLSICCGSSRVRGWQGR